MAALLLRDLLLATLATTLACGCWRGARPALGTPFPNDSWVNPLPSGEGERLSSKLSPVSFGWVPDGRQLEAQARLSEAAVVPLSSADTTHFAGEDLGSAEPSGTAYLLRGICFKDFEDPNGEPSGTLTLSWAPGAVDVLFTCGRDRHVPMERRAVLATLPSEPSEVYVSALYAIHGGVESP